MSVPILCVALLAFLCLATAFNVSRVRAKTRTICGGDTNPEGALYKAQRAHGNTVEYVPLLALLIYLLGQSPQPSWVVWAMVLVTVFRYLVVAGLLIPATMAKPNPMRFIGALGTYLAGLALVIATAKLAFV